MITAMEQLARWREQRRQHWSRQKDTGSTWIVQVELSGKDNDTPAVQDGSPHHEGTLAKDWTLQLARSENQKRQQLNCKIAME